MIRHVSQLSMGTARRICNEIDDGFSTQIIAKVNNCTPAVVRKLAHLTKRITWDHRDDWRRVPEEDRDIEVYENERTEDSQVAYVPSEEEIAEACLRIQATWTDATRADRGRLTSELAIPYKTPITSKKLDEARHSKLTPGSKR